MPGVCLPVIISPPDDLLILLLRAGAKVSCQILGHDIPFSWLQQRPVLDHVFHHGAPLRKAPVTLVGCKPAELVASGAGTQDEFAAGACRKIDVRIKLPGAHRFIVGSEDRSTQDTGTGTKQKNDTESRLT